MKQILFVSHTLDFAAGGAERVLFDVLKRIDRRRFEISLATTAGDEPVPPEFQELDIAIHALPHVPIGQTRGVGAIFRTGVAIVRCQIALAFHLRRNPYDLIHVNSIFALHFVLLSCLLTRTPVIYHEHGLPQGRVGSLWSIAYRWLIRHTSHTVAITDAVREGVLDFGVGTDSVTTVHNGIDLASPTAIDVSMRGVADFAQRRTDPEFKIVQIANILDWKGQDLVLEALSKLRTKLPEARVVFYGQSKDDEFESRLRRMVIDLNLSDRVEFGGYRTDLPELLPTFDCLVVASRAEPFGLVLLEAMRAGVPIAASNAGGVPEIVSDGANGLLFKSGDAEDLASTLLRIAEDAELACRLATEGVRVIRARFSLARQVQSMEDLFDVHSRRAGLEN